MGRDADEPETVELQPHQRRVKPPVTDADFEIVGGPRPPDWFDKLKALMERVPFVVWFIIAMALVSSKVIPH